MQTNMEIRQEAAGAGVKLWQIADKLGITDSYFSRKLERNLPTRKKKKSARSLRNWQRRCKHGAHEVTERRIRYIKEKDPQTALTPHALRCMVLDGTIPHVDVGRKKLINLDVLDEYLEHPERFPAPEEPGKIRPMR